jgi:outer membrane lipoprotein-sorting protein
MKKSAAILMSLFIVFYAATMANAFVLLGPQILELMRKELGTAERLLVSQKLIIYQEDFEQGVIFLDEKLRYIFPDTFRSDILSENVEVIHVFSKGRSVTVIDGKITSDRETELDHYKDIILYNTRELLEDRLPKYGLDVYTSSLGRFQGRLAYIVGAQYPDETVPQLWVDKHTFKPFRWIMFGGIAEDRADLLEFRFFEWRQVDKIWYPMRIEFYQNENLVRMIQVDEIRVNVNFPDKLFDIKYLRSTYPRVTSTTEPETGDSEELNELQKVLEKFQKIVE